MQTSQSSGRPDRDVPSVSVLIAVYNGMPYVESAVRSMMEQTLRDIEIIVVDDCSTDATPEVLARLAAEDTRIRILRLEENHRLPRALNRGLEIARAPYVARMDADDISHPTRLQVQKDWLDRHPEVVLLGASNRQIGPDGKVIRISRRPRDARAVRWFARFNMPLTHPTFMFRRQVPGAGDFPAYRPEAGYAEDYDFVARALEHGEVVSLGDVLLDYRVHASSITGRNWRRQQGYAHEIALRVQTAALPADVVEALAPFRDAYFNLRPVPPGDIFTGLRAMMSHDLPLHPDRRTWMQRQVAQLAVTALHRSGVKAATLARAFALEGVDFLPALVLRGMEVKELLPRRFRSDLCFVFG